MHKTRPPDTAVYSIFHVRRCRRADNRIVVVVLLLCTRYGHGGGPAPAVMRSTGRSGRGGVVMSERHE